MKVMIVKELMTGDVSPVAMFFPSLKTNPHLELFQVFKTKKRDRSSMEGKEGEGEGDWKRLKVCSSQVNFQLVHLKHQFSD